MMDKIYNILLGLSSIFIFLTVRTQTLTEGHWNTTKKMTPVMPLMAVGLYLLIMAMVSSDLKSRGKLIAGIIMTAVSLTTFILTR